MLLFSWLVFWASFGFSEECLKGAIHVHSYRSHDSKGSFKEIGQALRTQNFDFVILTDHQPPPKGVRPRLKIKGVPVLPVEENLLWIEGAEVTIKKKHQVLVLGSPAGKVLWLRGHEMEGLLEAKAAGAFLFLGHTAYSPKFPYPDMLDGVEIYNPHMDIWRAWRHWPRWLHLLLSHKDDLRKLWLSFLRHHKTEIKIWHRLVAGRPLGIMGGNDAHQNVRVMGRLIDPYDASFEFLATYVWAEGKSEEAILKALAGGRSYVGFPVIEDARGFRFEISSRTLSATLPQGAVGNIKIFKDNKKLGETTGESLSWPVEAPGLYRVEAWRTVRKKKRPWIYSNIIRVKESDLSATAP
ncbi:MAG: hypothetical protein HYT79_08555 [Elusimicrobia bacterium]|nr:hypothetical protein [Elusimicrobiota bacterium]